MSAAVQERSQVEDADVERFHRQGFVVVRGLFSVQEAAEIRDAFMRQAEKGPVPGLSDGSYEHFSKDDPLSFYPRMMHPHRHPELPVGPLAMRYMLDPRLEAILSRIMDGEPLAAQSMFYFKPAGARGQALHQDNFYLRVKPGTCVAAWVAIDDADQENGGMVCVPESGHLEVKCPERADQERFFTRDFVEVPEGMKETPLKLKAGDVFFFNGSLIHGSYPNTSRDRFRRAFICHYVPRASEETSRWYRPLLTFDGGEVDVADATGGGPCGEVEGPKGAH